MATIGKVSAVFTASTSGLVAGTSRAQQALGRLQGSVDSLRGSTGMLVAMQGAQMFAGIASAAGRYAQQLVGMGQAQAEVIDGQSKLAARLGISLGEFQGLALAADLAGVSQDKLALAMTKADVALVKAGQGSAQATAAFATLGLSVDQLQGMSASERFQAIAQAISLLPTEAERAAASMALFGKSGAELLPMFAGGAEGIRQAAEQAQRLGITLTSAQGRDVEAMNDSFTMVSKTIGGIVGQVTAYLAPAITSISDKFVEFVGSVGGANIGQAIGDGILTGAKFLAGVGDWIIGAMTNVGNIFASVGLTWENIGGILWRAGGLFQMVAGLFQTGISFVLLGFGKVAEGIMRAVDAAAGLIGMNSGTSAALKAIQGVNDGLQATMTQGARNFQAGASQALGDGSFDSGNANFLSGLVADAAAAVRPGGASADPKKDSSPVVATLDESAFTTIDAALQTAAEPMADVIAEKTGKAVAAATKEQVRGLDSRSQEGAAEMFRLMRGRPDPNSEDAKQTTLLERIAANTRSAGDDSYAVEFF